MKDKRVDVWACALWDHFLPQIASGEPFYLAADGELIRTLLSDVVGKDVEVNEALSDFHQSCNSLFNLNALRATVKDEAFEKIYGKKYSRVICLAVQQVLVVELMLNDEYFSENSYFPRYRDCLGISSRYEHNNPLFGGSFQEIWNVFDEEIKSVPDANPNATFFPGSGKDLNRNLPFSQALFTTHDLSLIKERSPVLNGTSEDNMIRHVLFKIRNSLGKRAQKLIEESDDIVQMNLCRQVKSFFSSFSRISALRPKIARELESGNLIAFLDDTDETDYFSVFLRTNTDQVSGVEAENVLFRRCQDYEGVAFALKDYSYVEISSRESVASGEALLFVCETVHVQRIFQKLGREAVTYLKSVSSNLPKRFSCFFCDSLPDESFNAVFGSKLSSDIIPKMELVGGLMVDAQSKVFLVGYPPTEIRHRGNSLRPDDLILVNGKQIQVKQFLLELSRKSNVCSFSVSFLNDKIDFAISPFNPEKTNVMFLGYSVELKALSISPTLLRENEDSLRGTVFRFTNPERVSIPIYLTKFDLLLLVDGGRRVPMSTSQISTIIGNLISQCEGSPLGALAIRQISHLKSVPAKAVSVGLVKKILAA